MKLYEVGSDLKGEVVFKVNDMIREQYGHEADQQGLVHTCFVPMETSGKLAVTIYLDGTFKEVQFDFLVDGLLRNVRSFYSKMPDKRQKKKVEFATGIEKEGRKIRQMIMRGGELPRDLKFKQNANGEDSVGCIEVRISVKRASTGDDEYTPEIPLFEHHGSWRSVYAMDELKNEKAIEYRRGPAPTHEIRFNPIAAEPCMNQSSSGRTKRAAREPRPGHFPWVTIKFYYRHSDKIYAAKIPQDPNDRSYLIYTPTTDETLALALINAAPQKSHKWEDSFPDSENDGGGPSEEPSRERAMSPNSETDSIEDPAEETDLAFGGRNRAMKRPQISPDPETPPAKKSKGAPESVATIKQEIAALQQEKAILQEDKAVLQEEKTVLQEEKAILQEEIKALVAQRKSLGKEPAQFQKSGKAMTNVMARTAGKETKSTKAKSTKTKSTMAKSSTTKPTPRKDEESDSVSSDSELFVPQRSSNNP